MPGPKLDCSVGRDLSKDLYLRRIALDAGGDVCGCLLSLLCHWCS